MNRSGSSRNASSRKSSRKKPKNSRASKSRIETFSAKNLQGMDFPPLSFAVEGLIAEGLTLLTGKPKMGKSWMALELAMAVSTGDVALGAVECEQGPVLYCALEDNRPRLQRRMKQRYGERDTWPETFHFATQLSRLDETLLEDLEDWITEHGPRLVIIDTFACIRPLSGKEAGYASDYASLAPLQELAGQLNVAIVVVHHLRKMHGDDRFDMISGTTGLTGAVDAALVLNRDSNGTTLYGRGRDIEEFDIALEFEETGWRILGEASEVRRSRERSDILRVVSEAGIAIGPKQIAEALNKPENSIKQLLRKMVRDHQLIKKKRGRYIVPSTRVAGNLDN